MKTGRIFWGLAFVLAAVCLIFNDSLFFGELSIWSALISVAAIVICVEGLYRLSFGKIIFGGAVFLIIWKEKIGLEDLSNWDIIIAGILLGIGLSILFGSLSKKRKINMQVHEAKKNCNSVYNEEKTYGQKIKITRNFSGGVEYVKSNDFQKAYLDVHFSGLKIYFDDAVILGDSATIHMDVAFSGVELYIPGEWAVDNRLDRVASGLDISANKTNIATTKTLKLKGNINFGSLKIVYI